MSDLRRSRSIFSRRLAPLACAPRRYIARILIAAPPVCWLCTRSAAALVWRVAARSRVTPLGVFAARCALARRLACACVAAPGRVCTSGAAACRALRSVAGGVLLGEFPGGALVVQLTTSRLALSVAPTPQSTSVLMCRDADGAPRERAWLQQFPFSLSSSPVCLVFLCLALCLECLCRAASIDTSIFPSLLTHPNHSCTASWTVARPRRSTARCSSACSCPR